MVCGRLIVCSCTSRHEEVSIDVLVRTSSMMQVWWVLDMEWYYGVGYPKSNLAGDRVSNIISHPIPKREGVCVSALRCFPTC